MECLACGVLFLDPQPDDHALAAAYSEEIYYAYSYHDQERHGPWPLRMRCAIRRSAAAAAADPRLWRRLLNPVYVVCGRRFAGIPVTQPGVSGRLLDVGCGDGAYLDTLRGLGWNVVGIETSPTAVRRARAAGLAVLQGTFESVAVDGPFDVVRMWHVLEHVRDPRVALARARTLLAPGGCLIVGLPNVASLARQLSGLRWTAWHFPQHLYHFTPSAIRGLLERSGFAVTRLRHTSVGTLFPSWHQRIGHWLPVRAAALAVDAACDTLRCGDSLDVRAVMTAREAA